MWRCSSKYGESKECGSPIITENELKYRFVEAVNEIIDDRELVLERCRSLYENFSSTVTIDEEINECLRECEIISELNRKWVEENASRAMDQQVFMQKHDAYVSKYEEESKRLEELKATRAERERKAEIISAFMFEIHERENFIEDFSDKLWLAMIDVVIVNHDGSLVFRFKNGMEVTK